MWDRSGRPGLGVIRVELEPPQHGAWPAVVSVSAPTSPESLTSGVSCPYCRSDLENSAPARLEPPGAWQGKAEPSHAFASKHGSKLDHCVERAVVLQLLRDDHERRWPRVELERKLADIEQDVLDGAVSRLTATGVVSTEDDAVWASDASGVWMIWS